MICRMGEIVDRTLLKHLLRMFSALGIYSESFERQFLECTADFYAAEGTRFMQQTDVPDYLKHVEVCKGGLPLPCSRRAW
jgi:cullin-4